MTSDFRSARTWVCSFLALVGVCSCRVEGVGLENLVLNGGFEAGLWETINNPGTAALDTRNVRRGKQALRLVASAEGVSLRTLVAPLEPGRKYRISIQVRTWQLKDDALYVKLFVAGAGDAPACPVGLWYKEIGEPGFVGPSDIESKVLLCSGGSYDWRELHTTIEPLPKGVDQRSEFYLEIGLKPNAAAGPRSDIDHRNDQEFGWLGNVTREAIGDKGVVWIDDVCVEAVGSWPDPGPCKGRIKVKGEIGGVSYFHGRDAELEFTLSDFDPETMQAAYRIRDAWGKLVVEESFTPVKSGETHFAYTLKRAGTGYFHIALLIRQDGKEYMPAETSYGVLPRAEDDYYEADMDSPFGLWLVVGEPVKGDMTFRDIGVKWTSGSLTWAHWKWINGRWEQFRPNWAPKEVGRFRPQNVTYYATTIMRGTPKFLSSHPNSPHFATYPPKKLSDMDAYIERNFEVHEGYPKVWGALNETSYPWNWRAGMDQLIAFLQHFYDKCKHLDPHCIVAGPAAGSWNVAYVERFLAAGGASTVDAMDIHFNTQAGDMENMDFTGKLRELKAAMRKYGGEKPIIIGEFGFNAYLPGCTELNQAWRMVKGFVLGMSEGVWVMTVHNAFFYRPDDNNIWHSGTSLIHYDRSILPGFVAYGIMTRQLYKCRYVGQLQGVPTDCSAYVFAKGGQAVVVAWQKNKSEIPAWCKGPMETVRQEPKSVWIPVRGGKIVRVVDLFGKTQDVVARDGAIEIELGLAPVYMQVPLKALITPRTNQDR